MMRGNSGYALAVRDDKGRILVASQRQTTIKKWYHKTFIIRGMVSFVLMLVLGMSVMQKSADAFIGEEEKLSKKSFVLSMILGLALSVGLFILLPSFLSSVFSDVFALSLLYSTLIEAGFRLLIFIGYLLLVSFIKDIRRTYMYHGAEHKTINCFESGNPMTIQNVQACSTKHRRCGTTFLFFVMIVSIILFSAVSYFLIFLKPYFIYADNRFFKMAIRLLLLPLVAGLSYELLKLLAHLPNNLLVRILEAPGLALQKLTTKEPTDDMIEVALASFVTAKSLDDNPTRPQNIFGEFFIIDIKSQIIEQFHKKNIESAEFDWIICNVLQINRSSIMPFTVINKSQYDTIQSIVQKRLKGIPLDQILQKSNFYGLDIIVDNTVLIPRLDTEILVEQVLKIINKRYKNYPLKILDLCTGSGCIAKAIAHNANNKVQIIATDISLNAINIAKQNLQQYQNVQVIQSDLFENLAQNNVDSNLFDIIITNPPYIPSDDIQNLSQEVQNEPHLALDGGYDGLQYYIKIISQAKLYLVPNGILLLEIGSSQQQSVTQILIKNDFVDLKYIQDYNQLNRVIIAKVATN